MKQLLIIFTLFLIPILSQSQELSMKWGETNDKDVAIIVKLVGQDSKGDFYAISVKQKKYFLEIYNSDLERKKMVEIEMPKISSKDVVYEDVFLRNDKLTFFASQNISKVNSVYAYQLSPSTGRASKKVKVLDIPIEKKKRSGNIIFHQEEDDEKLLVGMFVPKKKEGKQIAEFKLYDENLELISEAKKRFKYSDNEDDQIFFENAKYDKDGNIYVLTYSKEKQGKVRTLEYTLTKLATDGSSDKIVLGAKDKPIEKMDYSISEDGYINVFGFFVIKKRAISRGIDGAFVQRLNISPFETANKRLIDFNYEHKKLFLREKQAKKDKAMPNDFSPMNYYENKDGSFTMVAERRLRTVTRDQRTNRTTTRFAYQDIMILKIDEDGKVVFIKDVDKRQSFAYTSVNIGFGALTFSYTNIPPHRNNLPYMSFMPIRLEDESIIFIYNDNPKNVGEETDKRKWLTNMRKGIPMMATIGADGSKDVKVIPWAKDDETIFRTTINLKLSESDYIIYGSNKRKDKLGKMTVQ